MLLTIVYSVCPFSWAYDPFSSWAMKMARICLSASNERSEWKFVCSRAHKWIAISQKPFFRPSEEESFWRNFIWMFQKSWMAMKEGKKTNLFGLTDKLLNIILLFYFQWKVQPLIAAVNAESCLFCMLCVPWIQVWVIPIAATASHLSSVACSEPSTKHIIPFSCKCIHSKCWTWKIVLCVRDKTEKREKKKKNERTVLIMKNEV